MAGRRDQGTGAASAGAASVTLADLASSALEHSSSLPSLPVTGISQDHRKVEPGHLFVARVGAKFDGHRYIRLAVERGAIAVVGARDLDPVLPWRRVPYIRVADDRVALARLAAEFHGRPSRNMTIVGVTGTDGKTTTSFLLHHLLSERIPCALASTVAVRSRNGELPLEGHFTTPEATEVQSYLARFLADGCSHAVLESSSHALAMHRLDQVDFDLAVWTNLSAEHLDYHGTLEDYRSAKVDLVRRARTAVLNRDDPNYEEFRVAASRVVEYGSTPGGAWRAEAVSEAQDGLSFTACHAGRDYRALVPMVGTFNVQNALAALAAAAELGLEPAYLVDRLSTFPGVPGRMQVVHAGKFTVVVDFAHTGPALEKALAALRPVVEGRLLLVMGAAGERDPGKRAPLGAAAARGADVIYLTEEDHRSEPLERILDQLEDAARTAGAGPDRIHRVPNRREAIAAAIGAAGDGDLVLLAGKGHETSLERSTETLPWDEAAEALSHLG